MFALTAALLLVSCLLLGLTFRMEFGRYLMREKKDSLLSNAELIANLTAAYTTTGEPAENWNFRIGLSLAADVAVGEVLIYDVNGVVVICTYNDENDNYLGRTVPAEAVEEANAAGQYYENGTLDGFFPEEKLAVCMPVISRFSGETLGGVVVFTEPTQVEALLSHTTNIFLLAGIVVFLTAVIASYVFANKVTRPLKAISKTAREFGHGNLTARGSYRRRKHGGNG